MDSDTTDVSDEIPVEFSSKPKTTVSKRYQHKYQVCWEQHDNYKRWIRPSNKGEFYFYCDFCCNHYKCGKAELIRHLNSKKHSKNAAEYGSRQKLTNMQMFSSLDTEIKKNEIKIACFIAEHNLPVNIVDHFMLLLRSLNLNKEVIKKMTCNRTKCTNIITGVTGNYQKNEGLEDLKTNKFSLIIDESTDRSSIKHLALVARYFNKGLIRDSFLSLIPVSDGTAANLHNTIKMFFDENNVPYQTNLIGFAADGAATMMGSNNSASVLLKRDIPELFIFKCICHSFALCAAYATKNIPDEVEVLTRDIYTHMNFSFKRLTEFQQFQKFTETKLHKILYHHQVRWLSLSSVVDRILEQYSALKLYFRSQYLDKRDKTVESIHKKLENPVYQIYLQFLSFILPTFTHINREFQCEEPKIHKLYEKVLHTYCTLLDFYIKPECLKKTTVLDIEIQNPKHFLDIDQVYFGPKVTEMLLGQNLSGADIHNIKINCLNFYISGAVQIAKRFPFKEMDKLKYLNYIDPDYIRNNKPPSVVPLARHFQHLVNDIDELDRQWRLLRNDNHLENFVGSDVDFWVKLKLKKNADGSEMYGALIQFSLNLLILPHSSANVERIFSAINLNKTKTRNRLSTDVLAGILYTKAFIGSNNCYDVTICDNLIAKHNVKMYD